MEKRTRNKLSLEEIIEKWKQPYMSIIFLTLHFQKKGLRLLHYRYALVKNPNIIINYEVEMKKFFERKLQLLYGIKEIEKCISTTENLSKFLKKLVVLEALKRIPDEHFKNLATYKIDGECLNKIDLIMRRTRLINNIRTCNEPLLRKLEDITKKDLLNQHLSELKKSSYPKEFKKELRDIYNELFSI